MRMVNQFPYSNHKPNAFPAPQKGVMRFGVRYSREELQEKSNQEAKISIFNSIAAIGAGLLGNIIGAPWIGFYFALHALKSYKASHTHKEQAEAKLKEELEQARELERQMREQELARIAHAKPAEVTRVRTRQPDGSWKEEKL